MVSKTPAEETFGTFSKDGQDDVVAYSQKRAVALRFDGWTEKGDAKRGTTKATPGVNSDVQTPPTK